MQELQTPKVLRVVLLHANCGHPCPDVGDDGDEKEVGVPGSSRMLRGGWGSSGQSGLWSWMDDGQIEQ